MVFRRIRDRLNSTGVIDTPLMPPDACRIVDGALLLREHRSTLKRMAELAGVPDDHFTELYLGVADSLACFLQGLPSPDSHFSTLLDAALMSGTDALKRRQGHLLPKGADTETISKESDLWTYAAFTASVLTHVGHAFAYKVLLYNSATLTLGRWNAASGPMPDTATWYRIDFSETPKRDEMLPSHVGLMLAEHILPSIGMAWLWSNHAVVRAWIGAITADARIDNELATIVRPNLTARPQLTAAHPCPIRHEQSTGAPSASPSSQMKQSVPSRPRLDDQTQTCLEWVGEQLSSTIQSSEGDPAVHRVSEGVLVTNRAFRRYGGVTDNKRGGRARRALLRSGCGRLVVYRSEADESTTIDGLLLELGVLGDCKHRPIDTTLHRISDQECSDQLVVSKADV